jgi:hypothetical protein
MQPSTKKILLLRNLTDLNDESKIKKKIHKNTGRSK